MKKIGEYWWPEEDKHCHRVVPGQVKDIERALKHCTGMDTVIQAGGNVGIWPIYLSDYFQRVITFEPVLESFLCMDKNITERGIMNIEMHNLGLSDEIGTLSLNKDKTNVGAHQTGKDETTGASAFVAATTIDAHLEGIDLDQVTIDLIILDVEGIEPYILDGARELLKHQTPVLMIEDKGLSERFGHDKGWTDSILGYKVVDNIHRDVILIPDNGSAL